MYMSKRLWIILTSVLLIGILGVVGKKTGLVGFHGR